MLRYGNYITEPAVKVITALESRLSGLTASEVAERGVQYGPNNIEYKKPHWRQVLLRQFNSFFIYLLGAAAAVDFLVTGSGKDLDAWIIIFFIFIYSSIGFYQEYKAENAIFSLRSFLIRYARVQRDHEKHSIPISELVPGDIVFLHEGDLIPADIRLINARGLIVDESILTGESVPVLKSSSHMTTTISNDLGAANIAFFGSTIVGGHGEGIVISTGKSTYFGDAFEKISQIERPSLFEKNIKKLGTFLGGLLISLAILILLIRLITGQAVDAHFFIFLVALIVAVVPEALPLVTTLAFSNGALKLAQQKVVIKRLTAIEDLGNISVFCTDKTGTITKNQLTVTQLLSYQSDILLELGMISVSSSKRHGVWLNPFDQAIVEYGGIPIRTSTMKDVTIIESIPFDSGTKINSVIYRKDSQVHLVSRGAPEVLIHQSSKYLKNNIQETFSDKQKKETLNWFHEAGLRGERVIGIAMKQLQVDIKENNFEDIHQSIKHHEIKDYVFVGLISFSDPLKETSPQALQLIEQLGVKLKIITGDAVEVAGAVGFSLGLIKSPAEVLSGEDFEKLDASSRREAVQKYNVFARTLPQHKYQIIEALKHKQSVAFLGEGFNDVPALKIADVSLVVENAADMSRNIADVVLLKDDLLVIAQGIEGGRRVFSNILKYIRTTLAANVGNFFSTAMASFLFPFLPILPTQILLLNLLTDLPMISISLDTVNRSEINRPIRFQQKSLYLFFIIFGLVNAIFDLSFFFFFRHFSGAVVQTGWFEFSVLEEVVAFFSLRTFLPIFRGSLPAKNIIFLSLMTIIVSILLPLYVGTQSFFKFTFLGAKQWLLIALIAALYFAVNEIVKYFFVKNSK